MNPTKFPNTSRACSEDEYDKNGYDKDGYDRQGFNRDGLDRNNFDKGGYFLRTTSRYDSEGYDWFGYNRDSFDREGYHWFGFNCNGFDREGYDRSGFNHEGFDRQGFGRDSFNLEGYDNQGFNRAGFDREGFSRNGFNGEGFDRQGFGRDGYNLDGYDRQGFNRAGIDRDGFDRNGFNDRGLNREGFDRDGYNLDGYDRQGFDRTGFDCKGFDRSGFNGDGLNRKGFGRDGYDIEGYDENGFNKDGINRKGSVSAPKWLEIVSSFPDSPLFQNEWPAEDMYRSLNDQDFALASEWANEEKDNDYTMARMLSARAAEKTAVKFYQALQFKVNDVSIKQLKSKLNMQSDKSSQDWKLYDLLLNDEDSIDVKNARTPLNSKVTYVEHCVSRFKKNRNDQNVIIAGVLSPYLKLDDIKNSHGIRDKTTIKYLGETTISNFSKLEARFTKRLLKISLHSMNFIPRWMFEFPERFYEKRNQYCTYLHQVAIDQIPTIEQCTQGGVNPIPAYLSSGINLPDVWRPGLKDWQIDYYNRMRPRDNSFITMPVLFLALLTHFLEAVSQKKLWADYEPNLYRQVLYADFSVNEELQMPLGIFDPLGTIDSLIETLSILWNNKDHTNLNEFELFKFNGVGLLEGKRLSKQKYETILAYCGGFVEGKGKCGNNPLIIGMHESCPDCSKLICEKCGHCSINCPICNDRMKKVFEASYSSIAEDAHYDFTNHEENRFDDDIPF